MSRLSRHEKALAIKDENEKIIRNPNKIIINQHIIPRKHILEWSTDNKMVNICEFSSGNKKQLQATSPYFCVMRLWDQWTETQMLGENEANYQEQNRLFRDNQLIVNHEHIMAYYVMLCVRTWVANKERPDYPSSMENLSHEPTKAELEENELEMTGGVHIVNVNSNESSQQMARQVVKDTMSMAFTQWCQKLKGQTWIPFQNQEELFILPDSLYENFLRRLHILPICPNYVLISETTNKYLKEKNCLDTSFINNSFKECSKKYYVHK